MSQFDLAALLTPSRKAPTRVPVVQEGDLAALVVVTARDTRCEVLRHVETDDPTGGVSSQWIIAGSYECGITSETARAAGEDLAPAQGVISETFYSVHLPPDADVRNDDRLGVPGWFNAWKLGLLRLAESKVIPSDTRPMWFYECVKSGNSGSVEPDWPVQVGAKVADGAAVWRCAGRCSFLEVVGVPDAQSSPAELVVRAKDVS